MSRHRQTRKNPVPEVSLRSRHSPGRGVMNCGAASGSAAFVSCWPRLDNFGRHFAACICASLTSPGVIAFSTMSLNFAAILLPRYAASVSHIRDFMKFWETPWPLVYIRPRALSERLRCLGSPLSDTILSLPHNSAALPHPYGIGDPVDTEHKEGPVLRPVLTTSLPRNSFAERLRRKHTLLRADIDRWHRLGCLPAGTI